MGPEARSARTAELQGLPMGGTGARSAGPAALGDDGRVTGGAVAGATVVRPLGPVEQVAPRAVPARPSGARSGIVAYALSSDAAVGVRRFERAGAGDPAGTARACARFPSAARAQEAFLGAGGPARDPRGLDPDGDGFACGWDPTPFRRAVGRS